MGVQFTADQQRVIDLRDCNILVSAAAGSGKTAVLVERIITRLTKDTPPLNVDQLLVATFAEAAASEMKERIHGAIEKALSNDPENEHLQRQATLIHQANITTIHTFCLSVIRNYFHMIDLDPGFRVGETGEMKLLKRDVLEQVLEQAYEEANPRFLAFVENMASGKDDHGLEEIVLQLYDFASSHPKPEQWLDECAKQYQVSGVEEFEQKAYVVETIREVCNLCDGLIARLQFGLHICESEGGPNGYVKALNSDIDFLRKLAKSQSYVEMQKLLKSNEWEQLGKKHEGTLCTEKKDQAKKIRDDAKTVVNKWEATYFSESVEEICSDIRKAGEDVSVLMDLVKSFRAAFLQEKRRKNLIDFDDMGHYALQILTKETEQGLVPSEVAEHYQEMFAEIMVDEYQDVNYLQEAILSSVSRVHQGKPNVFMVGDVKQSIYRFRMSRPQLFLEKFHTYSLESGDKQRVDLHKNFRSRVEVLDGANALFEQLMIPEFGGVTYDDQAALHVGAVYEEHAGNETEVLLLDFPGNKSAERMELEAETIVGRIQKLVDNFTVKDKKSGEYRQAKYSDIVVLVKSPKKWNKVLYDVFSQAGISLYAQSKEGYFEAQEIQTVLNYLKILDNPRQDIPFASVLTSGFVGISSEELALIKIHSDARSLYENILNYILNGSDKSLQERLSVFMKMYATFREKVPYTAIDELLWEILRESGYADYVAALPNGEQRAANIDMLVEKAVAFENTSYKGLFNFIRYIEQLKKYEIDYGEAELTDEQADVVRLMSIHQSKGLEFPIVILAGMGGEFNTEDLKKSIFFDMDLGIGVDCVDSVLRTKNSSFPKIAIKNRYLREMKAEELRVLYVALTRAKEKMVLVGSASNLAKRISNLQYLQYHSDTQLPYSSLIDADSYLDWILAALVRGECFTRVLEDYDVLPNMEQPLYARKWPIVVKRQTFEDLVMEEVEDQIEKQFTKGFLEQWDTNRVYDQDMKEHLEAQFTYSYPYEQEQIIKQKMSVSELKRQMAYEDEMEVVYAEEEVIPLLPKFLQEEKELTGASRGTAYHKVMELLDFTKDYDENSLREELARQIEGGFLTTEMAKAIRVKDVLQFLESDIGRRVQEAQKMGRCYTEQPFVLGLPAKEVYKDLLSDEVVLIQGIIDVYFEEEDGLVVLDYKTDRVTQLQELKERYHAQLDYYAKALEQLTGKKVKEKVIYSFALLQEIEV